MSEEVKETVEKNAVQHEMYVQQVEWNNFTPLIERVTNVNRLYMYNMPNKAEKYADNVVDLIKTLDEYLTGDEEWRVSNESNVPFKYDREQNAIGVGNWVLKSPRLILCIPKLNSFFIIPGEESTYKGSPSPTHVIQLSNCISVMPMLLTMREIPDKEKEGVINIGMAYEMIQFSKDENEESPQ